MLRSIILYICFTVTLSACMQFRTSDRKILKKFKDSNLSPKIGYYKVGDRNIRYIEVGDSTKPLMLLLHGAPGSSNNFYKYMQDSILLQKVRMIAIDRPGYGYSDFGKSVISIEEQAALCVPVLEMNQNAQKPILVGYSFGGPVAVRLAMDYPDLTGKILMLAPAIDPENEKMFLLNKPANWKIFRWLVPKAFRVANDEKLSHVEELKKMLDLWKNVKNRTVFMHGYSDKIVKIVNSEFGKKMLINAKVDTIFKNKMTHMLIWKEYDLIKEEMIRLVEE